jgi:hypothetical protein
LFARENSINEKLPIMESETFVKNIHDYVSNYDIQGYYSNDVDNYPNGTYGLLEYDSEEGPQKANLRCKNKQCIEYMVGIIENKQPRENMTEFKKC